MAGNTDSLPLSDVESMRRLLVAPVEAARCGVSPVGVAADIRVDISGQGRSKGSQCSISWASSSSLRARSQSKMPRGVGHVYSI